MPVTTCTCAMCFGMNVQYTNSRIITCNTVPCVNSCKLDTYNYIFHTDNIESDLHTGNMDYEIYIQAYRQIGVQVQH